MARLALYDKLGPGPHPCHWCSKQLAWDAGHYAADAVIADHLDWDAENDAPENLVASCNACNAHRRRSGSSNRLKDDDLTVMWAGVRTRAVKRFCNVCGTEFLIPPSAIRDNKGRFCSRSCARTTGRKG